MTTSLYAVRITELYVSSKKGSPHESTLCEGCKRGRYIDDGKKIRHRPFHRVSVDVIQLIPQGEACSNGD
jgi:hypothetical protein